MKYLLRTIISLLLLLSVSTAGAETYFNTLSGKGDFNYTYISPYMLKAMKGSITTFNNIFPSQNLDEVEMISTYTQGTDAEFWKTIREVIKKFDLVTLSTVKANYKRTDVLGKLNDSNELTHLMIIDQTGGNNVSVTFITGRIPIETLNFGF